MIGIELLPGRQRDSRGSFQIGPKFFGPQKIFRTKAKHISKRSSHMLSVQHKVDQRRHDQQDTGAEMKPAYDKQFPHRDDILEVKHENAAGRQKENQGCRIVVNDFFSAPETHNEFFSRFAHLRTRAHACVTATAFVIDNIFKAHRGALILDKHKAPFFPDDRTGIDAIAACQTSSVTRDGVIVLDAIIRLNPAGKQTHPCNRRIVFVEYADKCFIHLIGSFTCITVNIAI